jgi:hypothetical protein
MTEKEVLKKLVVEKLEKDNSMWADDITFCANSECPQKENCKRWAKREYGLIQDKVYSVAQFQNPTGNCDYFIKIIE